MQRVSVLMLLVACATARPVDDLIVAARQNEVSALQSAHRVEVDVHGTVTDIAFSRAGIDVSGTANDGRVNARISKSRGQQPFVELRLSDGSVVFCYLMKGEAPSALQKGGPAHLTGRMDQFIRTESGSIAGAQLKGCRVR